MVIPRLRSVYALHQGLDRGRDRSGRYLGRGDGGLIQVDRDRDPLRRGLLLNVAQPDAPVGILCAIRCLTPLRKDHPGLKRGPVHAHNGACMLVALGYRGLIRIKTGRVSGRRMQPQVHMRNMTGQQERLKKYSHRHEQQ